MARLGIDAKTPHPRSSSLPHYARLGRLIRSRRQKLGITLHMLGRRTGILPARLSQYEHATHIPGRQPIARLAAALELDVATLWRRRASTLHALEFEKMIRLLRLAQRRAIAIAEQAEDDGEDIRTRRPRPAEIAA